MIKMTEVNPKETETYKVALDDHSLVVGAGEAKTKVWLSESMCKWISENYKHIDFKKQEWTAGVFGK